MYGVATDYWGFGLTLALARTGCLQTFRNLSGYTQTFRPSFSTRPVLTSFCFLLLAKKDKFGHVKK
ncbi:hypothetical protein NTG1052_590008 [Candidatus Nitrotoga sp. 1052]|nr:hypothetical protein NTG1052_590008 [Candidatus Nitrotoga sp. 1052]